ncbi:MAG: hypothetical protein EP321_00415 [Sphingomonadales bacterium]|nr:MAG: hypothetical protein EP345_12000 [Sphingomonadales bacterium]TNF06291.1 MAG: hypothetical protein EP321_00415 [Sphingomonadales bacterium]
MGITARFLFPAFLPALLLGGCTPGVNLSGAGPSREASACARSGGFLDVRGRRQTPICVHPYGDAGKACTTGTDCEGKCIAGRSGDGALPEAGTAATGLCQADDRLFGCYAEVEDGKARPALCVD